MRLKLNLDREGCQPSFDETSNVQRPTSNTERTVSSPVMSWKLEVDVERSKLPDRRPVYSYARQRVHPNAFRPLNAGGAGAAPFDKLRAGCQPFLPNDHGLVSVAAACHNGIA
jgi:hypothetical protein